MTLGTIKVIKGDNLSPYTDGLHRGKDAHALSQRGCRALGRAARGADQFDRYTAGKRRERGGLGRGQIGLFEVVQSGIGVAALHVASGNLAEQSASAFSGNHLLGVDVVGALDRFAGPAQGRCDAHTVDGNIVSAERRLRVVVPDGECTTEIDGSVPEPPGGPVVTLVSGRD